MKTRYILILLFVNSTSFALTKNFYSALTDSMIIAGKSKELITYLNKEIKSGKNKTDATEALSRAYFNIGDSILGVKYTIETVKLDPNCYRCYTRLARNQAENNDFTEALVLLDKAIEIEPNYGYSYLLRGKCKLQTGNSLGGLFDLNKAIELDPNEEGYFTRSQYYFQLKAYDIAITDLNKAIEYNDSIGYFYFQRGRIKSEKGLHNEALTDMTMAIRLEPDNQTYWSARGVIYIRINEFDKSIEDNLQAIKLDSTDFFSHYNLAKNYYQKEDMNKSCSCYQKAYELMAHHTEETEIQNDIIQTLSNVCDSTKASYYYQRGIANYNLNKFEEALINYDEGLKKFPDNGMINSFKGNALLALSRYGEAVECYYNCIKNKEDFKHEYEQNKFRFNGEIELNRYSEMFLATNYFSLAEALLYLNQIQEALKEINTAIQISESSKINREFNYNLRGYIYLYSNDLEKARVDFDKCIDLNPFYPTAYLNRAITRVNTGSKIKFKRIYVGLNNSSNLQKETISWDIPAKSNYKNNETNFALAIEDCDKALRIDDKNSYAYYVRGRIKYMMNRADYVQDIKKAIELGYPVENEFMSLVK